MRCYAAGRTTNAPTATLPGISVYAATNQPLHIVEIGVFNTTDVAFMCAVRRMTTAGTQGAAVDEIAEDSEYVVAATAVNSHTSTGPTIVAGEYARASIGAAIGSGVIWTFGGTGIRIPAGAANGIGILTPTGTGQVCDVTFAWEE